MEGGEKDGTRKNNCSKLKKITLSKVILVRHYKIFNLQQRVFVGVYAKALSSFLFPHLRRLHVINN